MPRPRLDPSRTTSIFRGLSLGALWTLAFVGIAAVGHAIADVPHPAYELFEWITRRLPGAVVTPAIDVVVALVRGLGASSTADAAKLIEKLLALGLAIGAGAVAGAGIAALGRMRVHPLWLGCGVGALAGALYVVPVIGDHRAVSSGEEVQVGFWRRWSWRGPSTGRWSGLLAR